MTPTPNSPNKTEMIRALPSTLTPSQVVAELAKKGVKVSRNLVYLARNGKSKAAGAGKSKKTTGAKPGPAKRGPGRPPKSAASKGAATQAKGGSLSGAQRELARAILNIGVPAAEEVFNRLRQLIG